MSCDNHVTSFRMAAAKCLLFLTSACLLFQVAFSTNEDLHLLFEKFIYKYKKTYEVDSEEFWHRFKIFKNNVKLTDELNKVHQNETVRYGINKFSDLTQEEFQNQYLSGLLPSDIKSVPIYQYKGIHPSHRLKTGAHPKHVDWRDKNIISAVKDQGSCGACWAFSVVETIESMYAKTTGKPVPDLAVQEVIDCAEGSSGCAGGDTCSALNWMLKYNQTIEYEADYPLVDKTQPCKLGNYTKDGVRITNFTCASFVTKEDGMLDLLSTVGPLAVTIDATTWKNYIGGIIKFHCPGSNNHAVQIVGYDLTGDVPYYIVRNSWGTDFGYDGYLYIKVGGNLCDELKRNTPQEEVFIRFSREGFHCAGGDMKTGE